MKQTDLHMLPWLLLEHQVSSATGYGWGTLMKMIDCGVFVVVRPDGCGQRRFQKVQIAQLLGIDVAAGIEEFKREPQLMSAKSVCRWTGYGRRTLEAIADAGGLRRVRPAGLTNGRFHREDVGRLLGFETWKPPVKLEIRRTEGRRKAEIRNPNVPRVGL